MQVFIPYKSVIDIAKAMYNDRLRYNKQILEIEQIIRAIEGAKAWRNHPVSLMYKEHKEWLECYMKCFEYYRSFKKSTNEVERLRFEYTARFYNNKANKIRPTFLDNQELLDSHKRRLYSKAAHLYPQFAEYGTSEINWYVVDGEIVKYKDGKRIKE